MVMMRDGRRHANVFRGRSETSRDLTADGDKDVIVASLFPAWMGNSVTRSLKAYGVASRITLAMCSPTLPDDDEPRDMCAIRPT